jgi:hypothetical protein
LAYSDPSVSDFKAFFVRDFPYGADINENVLDADISRALSESSTAINPECFSSQAAYTNGFLYLSAHNLVVNLRNSSQGLSSSFSWLRTGKSVGSVSDSFQIPDRISQNPYLSSLSKTGYGVKYLEMLIPKLSGQIFTAEGGTTA